MADQSNGASHDLKALFSSEERDFLVRNNGDQVKIDDLRGKIVGLYFSASWCPPCKRFTPKLIQVYNELTSKDNFEVVFISSDKDSQSYKDYFSKMPWLSVPFSDPEVATSLNELFSVNGIPCLVFLDENGKVLTDDAVGIIGEYGAQGYPFSPERLEQLKEEEEKAKKEQTLSSILVSPSRNFVIANDGSQVPISQLEGNTVGLYFSASSYGPCIDFTQQLADMCGKLNEMGESFKIVWVSLDRAENEYNEALKGVPWLALPFNDDSCSKLIRYFEFSKIPTLVIIGTDGKTLHLDASDLVEEFGIDAYPFTAKKLSELEEMKKAKLEAQTLESILVLGDRDFVIAKDGTEIPVSQLVGKNILLYFSAHWCPPCRAFLPKLIEAYHDIKAKDDAFEVIFISSDHDQSSFNDFFATMPWLALPYGDKRKKSLNKIFKVSGIPTVIAIGPTGRTVSENAKNLLMIHGAKAYPFTEERLKEIETELEEMAKGWPEKVNHELHKDHELLLRRRQTYACDGCEKMGTVFSYYCQECDFDLHPKCALEDGNKDAENGSAAGELACDGGVCYKK